MATQRSFQDMLNEYLTYDLLKEELVKRDYLLTKIEKENGWVGGTIPVPFKAAGASSLAYGGLTDSSDVSEDVYVRGEVTSQKELWGTMIFKHRDLMEHNGSISEKTFLRILPDAVDDFVEHMKMVVSINLLNGAHYATLTADATAADGAIVVDRIDRLVVGQKLVVKDTDAAQLTGYVKSIDVNASTAILTTTRGGATLVDFSAAANQMTVAKKAKVYQDGAIGNAFTSLKEALLPAAHGGTSTLYGVNKLLYPYTQSVAVDGSTVTASNVLDKLFDAYVRIRSLGKGNPNEAIVSYKHLASILKSLEGSKGSFNVVPESNKASVYGWTEIMIGGVKGNLKVIAVQEMDDDTVLFLDWRAMKFHTNGFFKKRIAPDGKHYFEQRSTSGYSYLVDMCVFGELIVSRPSYCGVMYGISY
jgi:hypothetical protein